LILLDDRIVDGRVGMANTYGQYAAEAIEIAVAGVVPDIFALAADESERLFVIGGNGGKQKFFVLADGVGDGRSLCLRIHSNYSRIIPSPDFLEVQCPQARQRP